MNANGDRDTDFIRAAIALANRGRPLSAPNPSVGCILVKNGVVIGRGWTQSGGRPHAEAMALNQAGVLAKDATAYVTLEPCAHESERGSSCTDSLITAGVQRIVAALGDPDPRTNGQGFTRLRDAGIVVETGLCAAEAQASLHGFLTRQKHGRPFVTLKLATSLDGMIAMADGTSQWITREQARRHTHLERSQHDAILVGGGTYRTDNPRLDVRLSGLEQRSPRRILLSRSEAPSGWTVIDTPQAVSQLDDVQYLMVEGGAQTASAFLAANMVDRLLLYRAPILIGRGRPSLGDIGLESLQNAHGRWWLDRTAMLGPDRMESYLRLDPVA